MKTVNRPSLALALCALALMLLTPHIVPEPAQPADAEAVLWALRRRGYRLGVIANQQPGTEQRLLEWNLLQFFDVIAASAEVGAAKPDPGLFLWALRHADCAPQNAAMIGDRIDNDILPAKALGMKTVRILSGPSAAYRPADDPADRTISSLSDLLLLF